MLRGEEKELGAESRAGLFRNDTDSSHNGNFRPFSARSARASRALCGAFRIKVILAITLSACTAGCGAGAGSVSSPPTPSPPSNPGVSVVVTPGSAAVLLGDSVGFAATVTGSSDAAVAWAVNGVPGGNSSIGVISASGMYQAPAVMPTPSAIQVEATSQATSSSSASAAVSVTSDVRVQVTPAAASAELGAVQSFAAAIASAGHPSGTVTWSLTGPGCGGGACGTLGADGTFTAPGVLPSPASVSILATSVADPSRSALAAIFVTSHFTMTARGPASVVAGTSAQFTAAIAAVPGSNPAQGVVWSLTGGGCSAGPNACGTVSSTGLYTAPATPPQPPQVTLTATSVADPTKTAMVATQVVAATPSLMISPANATVALEQTVVFSASFSGAPAQAVIWSVNNIPGGNASVGTISNSPAQNGVYLAPVNMPAARQVTISAASAANPALSASVTLLLTSNITISISPSSAVRVPGARQSFSASVAQTSNPEIGWTVNGIPNGNLTFGQICLPASNPCQPPPLAAAPRAVDFLAPAVAPAPPQITVEALSVADPARFGAATVTIASQITISIAPPSLTIAPGQVQTLAATVLGAADQNVTWDVGGSINGSIAEGLICLPASQP